MTRRIIYDNERWWRTTELKELFFYTLYNFNAYWLIGKIAAYTAKRIKNQTEIDVAGFSLILRSNELKHFIARHMFEKSKSNRCITYVDIENLADIVSHFSYVECGNKIDTLVFETNFPNSTTFVFVVEIDYLHKRLLGKSFRIKT